MHLKKHCCHTVEYNAKRGVMIVKKADSSGRFGLLFACFTFVKVPKCTWSSVSLGLLVWKILADHISLMPENTHKLLATRCCQQENFKPKSTEFPARIFLSAKQQTQNILELRNNTCHKIVFLPLRTSHRPSQQTLYFTVN